MDFGRRKSGRALFSWAPEVMLITAAAPVIGLFVNPADPYLLHGPFPWLMLAPLALALSHGLWAGLTSMALLSGLAGWEALSAGTVTASFARWSIGCGLTVLIAGQIRDWVRERRDKLATRADHLQDQLGQSERSRPSVQRSHAKLEARVISNRPSLAAASDGAERRIAGGHSIHELGQILLDVLATQGHLHAASLYVADCDHGLLLSEPVASFGGTSASSSQHPLVVRAFTTGKLASVVDGLEVARNDTSVLVAVPLITARRRTVGVVAVEQMPFMMFHADQLDQVLALAGHLADLLFDRWGEVPGAAVPDEQATAIGVPVAAGTGALPARADAIDRDRDITKSAAIARAAAITRPHLIVRSVDALRDALDAESDAIVDAAHAPDLSGAHAMDVMEHVIVSGVHAAADVQSVTISNTHAAADVESVTISNYRASDSVTVLGARAERIETLLAPEAPAPAVAAAESTVNQATIPMTDDASNEISITIVDEEPTAEVVAEVASPSAEPIVTASVVGVFERGSVVARATIVVGDVSLETRANTRSSVDAREARPPRTAAPPGATASSAPNWRKNVRALQSTTYEASRLTSPPAERARESVRTPLPAPVEKARTAILAAFARKAHPESSAAEGSALPSSMRAPRAAFAGYRPVTADLLRAPAQPVAAATRDSRTPVTTPAAKAAPSAPPAKAEDARASVRAAFAKARTPVPAKPAFRRRPSTAAHAFDPSNAAATPLFDETRAARPSIEEARAAMLATLSKARGLSRKPCSGPHTAAGHSRGVDAATANEIADVREHEHAVQPSADDSSAAQRAPATSAAFERSSTTTDATSAIRAAAEHARAAASHSTSATRQSAGRATLLPPPPAGFAAIATMAQLVAEPRSRTQPTRPLTGAAPRSSSSV